MNINYLMILAWNELVEGVGEDATQCLMFAACHRNRIFWFVYYWQVQLPVFNKKGKKIYAECQISKDEPRLMN